MICLVNDMNYINSVNELRGATFSAMRFVRGYGIINDRFDLSFKCKDGKVILEIETNIRIRDDESVLLAFNDLYLDKSRHEISIRRYRSQTGIEKTYLSKCVEQTNMLLNKQIIENIMIFYYGDIIIKFKNGILIEIFNDTHKEGAVLYRYRKEFLSGKTDNFELSIENNKCKCFFKE